MNERSIARKKLRSLHESRQDNTLTSEAESSRNDYDHATLENSIVSPRGGTLKTRKKRKDKIGTSYEESRRSKQNQQD